LGDCISLGLFINCFGGSHCLFRRRGFEALGGFTEDYGAGLDDHEFSMRAVLRGFKLMVVPQALYWYRLSSSRVRAKHFDPSSGLNRVFNAVLDNAPLCFADALRIAQTSVPSSATATTRSRTPLQAIAGTLAEWRAIRMIRSSGLFSADYYRSANPDVVRS